MAAVLPCAPPSINLDGAGEYFPPRAIPRRTQSVTATIVPSSQSRFHKSWTPNRKLICGTSSGTYSMTSQRDFGWPIPASRQNIASAVAIALAAIAMIAVRQTSRTSVSPDLTHIAADHRCGRAPGQDQVPAKDQMRSIKIAPTLATRARLMPILPTPPAIRSAHPRLMPFVNGPRTARFTTISPSAPISQIWTK